MVKKLPIIMKMHWYSVFFSRWRLVHIMKSGVL